jgi:RNA polymerase sigma-70 factor (sigma-E family)
MAVHGEPIDEASGREVRFPIVEPTFAASYLDLYRRHYGPMVRLAIALTGSNAAAEDIVQDSFVRLHSRWERIESPEQYLRRMVINSCHSAHRRAKRERSVHRSRPDIVSSLEADELFDALAKLPYRQRTALVLQYYIGLPQREIASILGCREGTVASLVHRALDALRRDIDR